MKPLRFYLDRLSSRTPPSRTRGRSGAVRAAARCARPVSRGCSLALALALAVVLGTPVSGVAQDPGEDPEARLREMGVTLPAVDIRTRSFDRVAQTGNLVFTSGHAPCGDWDGTGRGKVPSAVGVEEAQRTARQVGICLLASLKAHLGDLGRVKRVVKVLGMVNSEPDFTGQSEVMNGFSFFIQDVFGEAGHHARSAVGMAALPGNLTVEIEMVVEVDGPND